MLAVRWYLRYGLSYRVVGELLAERGVQVDHVTIYRWVQRFTPLLAEAARPCRYAVGDRSVDIAAPAGHLHVRFVDLPAVPDGVPAGPGGVGQQWREPLDPPVDGDVVDLDAALG